MTSANLNSNAVMIACKNVCVKRIKGDPTKAGSEHLTATEMDLLTTLQDLAAYVLETQGEEGFINVGVAEFSLLNGYFPNQKWSNL